MLTFILRFVETHKGFWITVGSITGLSALLRLYRITLIPSRIFDEVYSPQFAWNFLQGEDFYDVHPVLTELQHLPGLLLFGDSPLGWRFSPWLWMIVFTLASAYTVWLISRSRLAGVLMALFISLDTTFFVYGRTGLPDMFLLAVLALSLMCFFLSIRLTHRPWAMQAAAGSGIFLGFVISTKWSGLAAIASVWLWIIAAIGVRHFTDNKERYLPNVPLWTLPVWFIVIPIVTYGVWLVPLNGIPESPQEYWEDAISWHESVFNYHANLDATHPYSSEWWEWPILRNPVRFLYEEEEQGVRIIDAIGNPVLWWGGFVALIVGIGIVIRSFRVTIFWTVGSALLFWLPWIFVGRIVFNYHYFPTFFFSLILLSLFFAFLMRDHQNKNMTFLFQLIAVMYIIAAVIVFALMYPTATAMLVTQT